MIEFGDDDPLDSFCAEGEIDPAQVAARLGELRSVATPRGVATAIDEATELVRWLRREGMLR